MNVPDQAHETRARRIHAETPVILPHDHEPLSDDLDRCLAAGICGKVAMPVIDILLDHPDPISTHDVREGWAKLALAEYGRLFRDIEASGGRAFIATSADDFLRAHAERTLGVMLGAEGGNLIEGSLDLLHCFYRLGLRFLQLTWAFPNHIARPGGRDGSGLTAFGRALIPELNRLGVMIDIGHAGYATLYQVLELSSQPVLMAHGGADGAVRRSRHPQWGVSAPGVFWDDNAIRALVQAGGLFGVNFFAPVYFRDENAFCDVTLDDVIPHFEYIAELVGADGLSIGPDYFPNYGGWERLERSQNSDHLR